MYLLYHIISKNSPYGTCDILSNLLMAEFLQVDWWLFSRFFLALGKAKESNRPKMWELQSCCRAWPSCCSWRFALEGRSCFVGCLGDRCALKEYNLQGSERHDQSGGWMSKNLKQVFPYQDNEDATYHWWKKSCPTIAIVFTCIHFRYVTVVRPIHGPGALRSLFWSPMSWIARWFIGVNVKCKNPCDLILLTIFSLKWDLGRVCDLRDW